jgi:hypothetical protein
MWIEHLPGFSTSLLRCANGHDHSSWPVVGLIAERARGYGKTARPGVHCPECSVLTRSDVQSDPRPFAKIADACRADLASRHSMPSSLAGSALDVRFGD